MNAAAGANARQRAAREKKTRQFVTPEGVDLELRIASAGLRFGALLLDLSVIVITLVLLAIFIGFVGIATGDDLAQIVGLLGFMPAAAVAINQVNRFITRIIPPRTPTGCS